MRIPLLGGTLWGSREVMKREAKAEGRISFTTLWRFIAWVYDRHRRKARSLPTADVAPSARYGPETGERVLRLDARPYRRNWVRRRIDELTLTDERTIQHTVTYELDFTGCGSEDLPLSVDGSTLLLPLERLPRNRHVITRVLYGDGREAMRPTHHLERRLVVNTVKDRWLPRNLPPASWALVEEALTTPVRRLPRRVAKRLEVVDLEDLIGGACVLSLLAEDEQVDLAAEMRRWATSYLLLVELPREIWGTKQFSLRLQYADSIESRKIVDGDGVHPRALLRAVTKVLGGTLSFRFSVKARPGVGTAESSHFVVNAPVGFQAIEVRVGVTWELPTGESVSQLYWDDDVVPSAAHVQVPNHKHYVKRATLIAHFYSYKSGLLVQTLVATWILCGIVSAFYWEASKTHFAIAHVTMFESVYTAPLLLLLPAAVATIVTQSDAHRLLSRSAVLPRLFAVMAAAAAALAAALLAFTNVGPPVSRILWRVSLGLAIVSASRMTLSYGLHLYRTSRLRHWAVLSKHAGEEISTELKLTSGYPDG
jgi:hypothetical protein